ncbi:MAG TPA: hypothetical protein PKG54_12990 [Phycisphaerae bacterium]|nr:hypothetical protein [Phycisphaerae bacterium]HOB75427.1 hypothetical protein [Phycisphaerae bacterium]HOJ55640.1 hypothetical protein [Phycisphaerae bacterium]HOL27651.1 hypothetical protein [Phycisphaerae bacterium]HPP21953.1 hypothetical protein [Phycisphaerae bacterium]
MVADWIARGADLYRHFFPDDWIRYPNLTAIGVGAAGILLAFWGARLLKTIYILTFMVVGAVVGFRVGTDLKIDTLVGLTFGAGIAAFIGYLFFRWWVGVTTGFVAVLLVLAVAWPRFAAMDQGFRDYRQGVGTDNYASALQDMDLTPSQYVGAFSAYVWTQQREYAHRFMIAAGLAWLLGVVMGLLMPKFTTVMGTSVLGVLLTSAGVGVLLYRNWPEVWSQFAAHPDWCLIGMAVLLIVASWRQVRPVPVKTPAVPVSEPPPAGSPPAKPAK